MAFGSPHDIYTSASRFFFYTPLLVKLTIHSEVSFAALFSWSIGLAAAVLVKHQRAILENTAVNNWLMAPPSVVVALFSISFSRWQKTE